MARDQVDLTPIERRAELVDWIAQGVKPRSRFRIGTEHEKFAFTLEGHRPVPYEGYYDRDHHRWYRENGWVECDDRNPHCPPG